MSFYVFNIVGSILWKKHGAELFPCASGVQAPYVGQAESTFITSKELNPTPVTQSGNSFVDHELPPEKIKKKPSQKTRLLGDVVDPFSHESDFNLQELLPQTCLYLPDVGKKRGKKQKQQKMKEISRGLNFSHDVTAFHCSHLVDYDEESVNKTVYQEAHCGRRRTNHLAPPAGLPPKHTLCHFKGQEQNKLVHKPKAFTEIDDEIKQEFDEILFSVAKTSRPFKSSVSKTEEPLNSTQTNSEWDEYVLALLSKSTAKWLSNELSTGPQQARLMKFLKNRYQKGEEKAEDENEVGSDMESTDEEKKRQNSKFGAELDKVLIKANFEAHYSPSFTFPAAVGDKKLTSDNIFQQEMMAGAFPLRGRRAPRKSIVLDTNSHLKFEKKLQANFPEDPTKWSRGRRGSKAVKVTGSTKVIKGLQRWNDLPELLQVCRNKKLINCKDLNKSLRQTRKSLFKTCLHCNVSCKICHVIALVITTSRTKRSGSGPNTKQLFSSRITRTFLRFKHLKSRPERCEKLN